MAVWVICGLAILSRLACWPLTTWGLTCLIWARLPNVGDVAQGYADVPEDDGLDGYASFDSDGMDGW